MRRAMTLSGLFLVVLLAAACAGSTTTSGTPAIGQSGAGPTDITAPSAADTSKGGTTPEQGIPSFASADRSLILTASISFRAQDPWATADKARAIAAGLGGDLLALSQTGSGDQRSALLTVRVPSDRFDEALSQLKKLDGEVLTSNVDAKDVTDQYVDLQARLGAKKAEEQQYLTLLARANTVDEILKVQGALATTRLQIEQLQGQVNSLKTRIDYSTITMSIAPFVTAPGQPVGTWDPGRTFAQALASLSSLFRVVGDTAIWLLVFGWIPLVLVAFTFMATRARMRRVPAA